MILMNVKIKKTISILKTLLTLLRSLKTRKSAPATKFDMIYENETPQINKFRKRLKRGHVPKSRWPNIKIQIDCYIM